MLDGSDRVLQRGHAEVPLEPKVFDCLEFLVTRPGKLASVGELRQKLWPDAHVGEGALRRIINDLRRALGDTGAGQAMIRTRKGLGYVFVAAVELVTEFPAPVAAQSPSTQWPFVGRERELEQLRRWLSETQVAFVLSAETPAPARAACSHACAPKMSAARVGS